MLFKEKLKRCSKEEIWDEYCSFLDLTMGEYMDMQKRLLAEQIRIFSASELGRSIMKDGVPEDVSDFRKMVPLTTYEDYQMILLGKAEEMLPGKPVVWLETTWESGVRPQKVAPYTREMLDVYTRNVLSAMILSTSKEKGHFCVKSNARALYGLAPLPYATGLFPLLVDNEMDFHFMPSLKEAKNLSFSQQNKVGFKQAVMTGIDQLFGMSSIIYAITKNFDEFTKSSGFSLSSIMGLRPSMMLRIAKAKYKAKRDGRPLTPKDIFKLQGFVCVGTDTELFKNELEEAWGMKPLEIHGGTETCCLATETWSRDGLIFFPDTAFYEFIPIEDVYRNEEDPSYVPRTYLMDEVCANEYYELVLTVFKGGSFMRYRPGDVYRCVRTSNEKDGIKLPQFVYVDRVPSVIDIAGFTRITENSINKVLEISGIPVSSWIAAKEYDGNKGSFLHLFVETDPGSHLSFGLTEQLLKEHMGAYFRHYDHDFNDLKRLLGREPLEVTILPQYTIENFETTRGRKLRKMNPPQADLIDLQNSVDGIYRKGGEERDIIK
ncbi:MAG: GH3 auxin-responsive promoter family protein [Parasporobacterium sp.]|nr:GH3 auxin-responsive promoter family protein [Parasporobacterium sp.]